MYQRQEDYEQLVIPQLAFDDSKVTRRKPYDATTSAKSGPSTSIMQAIRNDVQIALFIKNNQDMYDPSSPCGYDPRILSMRDERVHKVPIVINLTNDDDINCNPKKRKLFPI